MTFCRLSRAVCALLLPFVGIGGQALAPPSKAAADSAVRRFTALGGSRESGTTISCVSVGSSIAPVTSGDFTIGGNGGSLTAGRVGKVWWRPKRVWATMPPLVVRSLNVENLRDTARFETTNLVFSASTGVAPPPEKRDRFFATGYSLPTHGTWAVIATSGDNFGCFLMAVA